MIVKITIQDKLQILKGELTVFGRLIFSKEFTPVKSLFYRTQYEFYNTLFHLMWKLRFFDEVHVTTIFE